MRGRIGIPSSILASIPTSTAYWQGAHPTRRRTPWAPARAELFGAGRACASGAPTDVLAKAAEVEEDRTGESRVIAPALRLSRAPTVNAGAEKKETGIADPPEEVKEDEDPLEEKADALLEREDADPEVDPEEEQEEPCVSLRRGRKRRMLRRKKRRPRTWGCMHCQQTSLSRKGRTNATQTRRTQRGVRRSFHPRPRASDTMSRSVSSRVRKGWRGGASAATVAVSTSMVMGPPTRGSAGRAPWLLRGKARLVGGARARLRL
ncbi:hypothetical protein C8R44DRAFT_382715 [Mycena epipterygia]|nr:hypothetical protein C8R44DRAFT_382715 [Mycena epipterygia]